MNKQKNEQVTGGEKAGGAVLGSLCITRFQASQCLNEREVRSPLPLKKPAKRGLLAF